ncbi:hypothetical protein [Cellvibrio sp. UBA7671]|jgi:hypothetical protein|uniref:hypothetical protein n=1 Tax=Cellvibrio sp. UBA7671 TaxID=1946312 RepID=UPI002F353BF5
MIIGIDGNMWYCSNEICIAEPDAKIAFAPTLKEAAVSYKSQYHLDGAVPIELLDFLDVTPEEYQKVTGWKNTEIVKR